MMDSEGISQLSIARDTMDINYDPQQGKKLFYATFDGKLTYEMKVSFSKYLSLNLG